MKWVDKLARKFGYVRRRRSYAAGMVDRLTSGWITSQLPPDEEIRGDLKITRNRSRDLCRNNDYGRKFIKTLSANVIGHNGISFQNKAKDNAEKLDDFANNAIETAWRTWGKKENASVTGGMTWKDLQRLFIETIARDGEILVRKVKGYENPFRFALQFLECDRLDENLNKDLSNGNKIRMSIERDIWGRAVNYYVLTSQPGELSINYFGQNYDVIPADEVIHAFIMDRAGQTRGFPWMHTAITRLKMISGYEEAELVAARAAACKMGFIHSGDGQFTGDAQDESGNQVIETEAGMIETLPNGTTFTAYDPKHPTGAFPAFMKAVLRGASSGLNISYNTLASDLEGVNFSSIRQGVLDDRNHYRTIQDWVIESFCVPVYEDWLRAALMTQAVPLPFRKFDKFNQPLFTPRGWEWVDPVRDLAANQAAINLGVKSRTMVAAEQGRDLEDVFEELKKEQDLAEQMGIILASPAAAPAAATPQKTEPKQEVLPNADDDEEETEED